MLFLLVSFVVFQEHLIRGKSGKFVVNDRSRLLETREILMIWVVTSQCFKTISLVAGF